MRDAAPQGTYKVQALDRAFAVLDLLGESETPLGLAQVAASLVVAERVVCVVPAARLDVGAVMVTLGGVVSTTDCVVTFTAFDAVDTFPAASVALTV